VRNLNEESESEPRAEGWLTTLGVETLGQWDVLVFLYRHQASLLSAEHLGYENPELFGVNQFMPDYPVSSIVDNMILLNFVELNGAPRRALTVAKARGSAHRFVTREYTIGQGGLTLLPHDEGQALPALPFLRYYNLLSRAPTRLSPDVLPGGGGGAAAAAAGGA
jgi:circadian clock protein KaiC